jgi:nucleoside-diphosphate-sugar epimerase
MKAIVTGAGGFIGAALVDRFVAQGHEVIAVVRRPHSERPGVRAVTHQLGEPLDEADLAGVDLVVHLAHDLALGSHARNVAGTMRWFEQGRKAGVPLQVYVSSYSAHATAPSEYGRAKYSLETFARDADGIVVRPGLVLGRGGSFGAMTEMVRTLPIVPIPGGDLRVFVTTIGDVLSVIASADRTMTGETFNVFLPEPIVLAELMKRTRHAVGGRGLLMSVPARIAQPLLAMAAPFHASLRGYRQNLAALTASQAYAYPSSYPRLGLRSRPIDALLAEALAP